MFFLVLLTNVATFIYGQKSRLSMLTNCLERRKIPIQVDSRVAKEQIDVGETSFRNDILCCTNEDE